MNKYTFQKKTIILGYGNPDRGDDGVAWHILQQIAQKSGKQTNISSFENGLFSINENLDLWFNLQLIPEVAEEITHYGRAFFIDAHTGEIKDDIKIVKIEPIFQNSPFTHHLTPSTCLSLSLSLYGKYLESTLVTVRGFEFNFSNELSERTTQLAERATKIIINLIESASNQTFDG
jgi:hydrogenase maturation protease